MRCLASLALCSDVPSCSGLFVLSLVRCSGHYVCLCKVGTQWLCYDDDDVHLWSVEDVKTTYGSVHTGERNGHLDGYLLFYSAVGE